MVHTAYQITNRGWIYCAFLLNSVMVYFRKTSRSYPGGFLSVTEPAERTQNLTN